MIDIHGNLFIESGEPIDCNKSYELPWMVPQGTYDSLYEWLLSLYSEGQLTVKPYASEIDRQWRVIAPITHRYATPDLAVIFGLRDYPEITREIGIEAASKQSLNDSKKRYFWYSSDAPAHMEWTVVNPTVGRAKPKAKAQGRLYPVTSTVKFARADYIDLCTVRSVVGTVYDRIATHFALSLKSQDAIADGEGRKVRLFKEFPAYYGGQAELTEERHEGAEGKAAGNKSMNRKTWSPFVTKGRPAKDDPRKRQPCTSLPKPNLKKKCTVKERKFWTRTLPEPVTMRAIDSPLTQHSNPELEQWRAALGKKARGLAYLKGIEGKIFKGHEKYAGTSVERFKQLGLWNGRSYPTGACSKIRWLFALHSISGILLPYAR